MHLQRQAVQTTSRVRESLLMGEISTSSPVLLILAAASRYDVALDWSREKTAAAWGNIALASNRFDFTETDYYEATMGTGLKKQYFAYEKLIDPANLADIKRETNAWEEEFARTSDFDVPRPLNLDPGYITLGKLVLASTKDHAHRIYLRDGIYAEVTLHFRNKAWQKSPWTYPDYQRDDFQGFFSHCREYLKARR